MPRPAISKRSASKEAYKLFKEKHPNSPLSFKDYVKALHTFNSLFIVHILETGDKVKLPYGFGPITICKKKQTTFYEKDGKKHTILPVDWQQTKELGYKVYLLNSHTSGFRYRWYWYPYEARFFQCHLWTFKPCRKMSRLLAAYLKKPNSEYKNIYRLYIKKK